jgi:hypothetical protein
MSIAEMPVRQGTQPRSPGPSLSSHARGVLRDRLISDFPSVAPRRIGALVDEAYARTSGARVQAFRVVLAEREVRAALRAVRRR